MLIKDDPLSAINAPNRSPEETVTLINDRNKLFLERTKNHSLIPNCVLENVQPGRPVIFVWRSDSNNDNNPPDRYYLPANLMLTNLTKEEKVPTPEQLPVQKTWDEDFAVWLLFADGHYTKTTPGLAPNAKVSNSPPFGRAATQSYTPREYLNLYSSF